MATYGQIAALAGNPRLSRRVAWVLSSSSRREGLPWQRVVNARGGISLPAGGGAQLQRALLESEGVRFREDGSLDLERYRWVPRLTRPE